MIDIKSSLSTMKDQVKLAAKNEVDKEKFEDAKNKLLALYRKKSQAEKILKNIENEIADYEMELDEA